MMKTIAQIRMALCRMMVAHMGILMEMDFQMMKMTVRMNTVLDRMMDVLGQITIMMVCPTRTMIANTQRGQVGMMVVRIITTTIHHPVRDQVLLIRVIRRSDSKITQV